MIPREEAVRLAENAFPNGPERLAERLNVILESAPLTGCEGWCLRLGKCALIRINSSSSPTRQRFTLAHELAHLVLGTRPDVVRQPFQSETVEERAADQLASELLIPEARVRAFLGNTLPVDAKTLQRLAKAARVSPIMAACRVVNMTAILGLENAAVAFFDADGRYQWQYAAGLRFTPEDAVQTRAEAMRSRGPIRMPNHDGNIVVCSTIDAQQYSALLLQLLPPDIASRQTIEERAAELRQAVFGEDHSFQQSVAACLGYIRGKYAHLTVGEALAEFDTRYLNRKWTQTERRRLRSEAGREYVRMELSKTCRPD